MPLPEGPHGDKDLEGFKPPADMEPLTTPVVDPSGTDAKYQDQTQSARLRYRSLTKNKGKTSSKVEPDSKALQLKTFANADESDSNSSCPAALKKYDNVLPLTERQLDQHEEVVTSYADLEVSVKGYYDENLDHMDQTDNLVKETMKTIDNISKSGIDERAIPLKDLNRFSETLEVNTALKEEMKKMAESYCTTSGNISGLTKHINNAKLLELLTKLEGMVTEMLQAFKGMSSSTPSGSASISTAPSPEVYVSVGGEFRETTAETPIEQELERPTRAVPISIVIPITRPNPELEIIRSSCDYESVPNHLGGGILRRVEAFVASPIGCGGSDVGIA
ncbi:hypothetical protein Tco_1010794 [Tanacetum coccineum]